MIELTAHQIEGMKANGEDPPRVFHPYKKTRYVLIPEDVYERLLRDSYDDSPWTDEEHDLLAAEVDALLDDDMAIEDTVP